MLLSSEDVNSFRFMCIAIQKQKSIMLHLHNKGSIRICVHVEFWTIAFLANAVCEVEQKLPNSYHQPQIKGSCECTVCQKLC